MSGMENVFDYFLKSDQGKLLVKQRDEELLAKRQESVAAIEKIKGEQLKEMAKLNTSADEAFNKVERARNALKKAEREHAEAVRIKRSKANQYELEIGNRERYLKKSADPMIDGFILELRDKAERLRFQEIQVSERPGKRNPITMQREKEVFSNIEQVKETLSAIREAIGKAESLKLMAVDNVEEELEAIRKSIPGMKQAVPVSA